jgi:hypothetical protein
MARALVTLLAVTLALNVSESSAVRAAELTIDAPPSLAASAESIRAVDLARLQSDLRRAGLDLPGRITVAMILDGDPRARAVPPWIVGLADGPSDIVIFPERVLPYPYDSVESVFRHEVAHLALHARAGGAGLPRWFHEGVAMAVDQGWGMEGRLRLLLEMAGNPGTAELARLFASRAQPEAAQAYGLSAALVADLRRRHGAMVPGAIAARVAGGAPFAEAFTSETGETPDLAASRAWSVYVRWTNWVPTLTSGSAVWALILASPASRGSPAAAPGCAGASGGTTTTNRRRTSLQAAFTFAGTAARRSPLASTLPVRSAPSCTTRRAQVSCPSTEPVFRTSIFSRAVTLR